ncbi:MAG TPA: EAL domain-containing protein [Acidimicrobiales bacterium]|nr:EAL domain-containing protein [Acidimicrobiales bacterium]
MQAKKATGRAFHAPTTRVWMLNAALVAAALLVFGFSTRHQDVLLTGEFKVAPWVVAVLFLVAEMSVVHIVFRRESYSFSLSEIPLVLGLFFLLPSHLVAAQLVGAGIALGLWRRQPLMKLCFNLAHMVLETCLAVSVLRVLDSTPDPFTLRTAAAAVAATTVAAAVSSLSICIAISLYEGRPQTDKLATSVLGAFLSGATNASLGLMLLVLFWVDPGTGWLTVAPAAVLLVAYRNLTQSREKQDGLEFLYQASHILHRGISLDERMVQLLTLARETFHSSVAELILEPVRDGDRGLRTAVGPGDQVHRLDPFDLDAVDLDAVTFKPGSAMVATLDGEHRRLGTIVIAGPSAAQGRFSSRQLHLFETFVNHVTVALENGVLETSLAQVTELKEELRHQAFHDELTGLGNRSLFVTELEAAVADGVAVLFVDLDDFKTVNDTLGHAAGDELLVHAAERLRHCLRPGDVAARLGGDEFAVLIGGSCPDDDAVRVAQRLLDSLGEPFTVQGELVHVGASVGVATTTVATNADDLLRHADVAMYTAKVRGKNRWEVFEPAMQRAVAARHAAKTQMQRAISRGEFLLHYQPIVDLWDGSIMGAEALVRWWHPERGLLPPSEFVPAAEDLGLIGPLGRLVLEQACAEARAWQRAYPRPVPVAVTVNVSAREFQQPDYVDATLAVIAASGVAPGSLILEITESAMVDGPKGAGDKLRALKAAGVRLAIDDFGTGYSSLSYLEELSIDVLKIAKPFVDGLATARNRPALAQAIVNLGDTLDLEVIAEGVEDNDQADALRAMGCRLSQGYVFAKPVDAVTLRRMLARGAVDMAGLSVTIA